MTARLVPGRAIEDGDEPVRLALRRHKLGGIVHRGVGEELFSVSPDQTDGGRSAYRFRHAKDIPGLAESWFRDSILANPELVIGPCRATGLVEQDEDWYRWAKEVTVGTIGSIDVLLVSRAGRVAIVETKLFFNPEARRTVLAQALDYAIHLPEMKIDTLPSLPTDIEVAREDVEEHLATGDFLLIIAGDDLDPRAVRLSEALLGEHMVNPWDLAMIDVSLYEASEQHAPKLLVHPAFSGIPGNAAMIFRKK